MIIESYTGMLLAEAEAERNRLRAVNAELVTAGKEVLDVFSASLPGRYAWLEMLRSAVAKAG